MPEPDVRLSDDERARFAALERLLTAPPPAGGGQRLWIALNRRLVGWTTTAAIGGLVLIGGLLFESPAVGAIGFVLSVFAIARMTRRVTWAWIVLRWRRLTLSTPPEHTPKP